MLTRTGVKVETLEYLMGASCCVATLAMLVIPVLVALRALRGRERRAVTLGQGGDERQRVSLLRASYSLRLGQDMIFFRHRGPSCSYPMALFGFAGAWWLLAGPSLATLWATSVYAEVLELPALMGWGRWAFALVMGLVGVGCLQAAMSRFELIQEGSHPLRWGPRVLGATAEGEVPLAQVLGLHLETPEHMPAVRIVHVLHGSPDEPRSERLFEAAHDEAFDGDMQALHDELSARAQRARDDVSAGE
jgi:hypothetical protein